MIVTLHKASLQVGLEMNIAKTKIMSNYKQYNITLNNKPLEYVENYIYLGKQIGFSRNNNDLKIERRVKITWSKYWGYKEVFKSNMPIKLKKKVMNTCLIPCLTYACQTWKFTNKVS
jgi:hypothetical protein